MASASGPPPGTAPRASGTPPRAKSSAPCSASTAARTGWSSRPRVSLKARQATGGSGPMPTGNLGWASGASLSGDGKLLLTTAGEALLWDTATGKKLQNLKCYRLGLYCSQLSHDGKLVAGGTVDGIAGLWDTATGKQLQTF